jgi:hypothetical protein
MGGFEWIFEGDWGDGFALIYALGGMCELISKRKSREAKV